MDFKLQRTTHPDSAYINVKLKRGIDIPVPARLPMGVTDSIQSSTVGLLGGDYPGTRFELLVEEGAEVMAGQAVMRDRSKPEIVFTAPASGHVGSVVRGSRRSLVSLSISQDNSLAHKKFDVSEALTRSGLRQLMLDTGLWSSLRSRPFGHIPDPNEEPDALLITAIDTRPQAPSPANIINSYAEHFALGVNAIKNLIQGPVFLCKSPDTALDIDQSNLTIAEFDGPHPAGLAGTHIHALCPIGFNDKQVWHIGYQEVISLGHLLDTGSPWFERVIALCGPAIANPRLVKVSLGASTQEIVSGESIAGSATVLSGSILDGRIAAGDVAFLSQQSCQITVVSEDMMASKNSDNQTTPLIATMDLDQAAPPDLLATPFLRALSVGDIDRVRDLGGLEFVEEDLALLNYVSCTRTDYGQLLRQSLEQLFQERRARDSS